MTTSTKTLATAQPVTVNPWMAALYGGVITAIIAIAVHFLIQTSNPVLYGIALLLLGVGPILGWQIAAGRLGSGWAVLIAGIIGSIIPILGQLLLWPLLVWLFDRRFSLGKLYLGSIIGVILGLVVFFVIGLLMGQDPYQWVGLAWTLGCSMWGGAAAAGMQRTEYVSTVTTTTATTTSATSSTASSVRR